MHKPHLQLMDKSSHQENDIYSFFQEKTPISTKLCWNWDHNLRHAISVPILFALHYDTFINKHLASTK